MARGSAQLWGGGKEGGVCDYDFDVVGRRQHNNNCRCRWPGAAPSFGVGGRKEEFAIIMLMLWVGVKVIIITVLCLWPRAVAGIVEEFEVVGRCGVK